ncbi:hypothetical protein C1H46_000345 [Malus baccata]|uniref:Uncharacterized protein n=1 Tax=Malus baccata TaxID=106549 RepID=A0A540NSN7_MALBA|nr:hypothetical protein C1H46_000345 [Malus baccata]
MLRPTRVFPTPPPFLCPLPYLAMLLMMFYGLFFLDGRLISFSCWLSLLCGCAWRADQSWMMRSARRCSVVDKDLCGLRCTILVEALAVDFPICCLFCFWASAVWLGSC